MRRLTGWLFDVYVQGNGISVWLIDDEGTAHHLHDRLQPSFLVYGSPAELRRVCEWITRARLAVYLRRAERYDVFAHRNLLVLEIQVAIPAQYAAIVQRIASTFPSLDLYNADLSIAQFYFFERKLFPLAYCRALVNDADEIIEIDTDDSRFALDYTLPPLRAMSIQLEGGTLNPNHGHRAPLEISYEDRTYTIASDDTRQIVERVREYLIEFDPDVIFTRWGDSFILPQLFQAAKRYRIDLPFNRDARSQPLARPARSHFSYGRIIYKAQSHLLFGRWHIDLHNSSILDYELDGAIEIARLTQQTMQQTVRVSTGTGISAMQVATAYEKKYLIPYHKSQPEEFKSGMELLTADKGGLTYQPIVGLHCDVAELDFASMYPAIMARYNVSPETMHCSCCPAFDSAQDSRVPEIGYAICRRERGLVPDTLAPLIEKRLAYKRRIKTATSETEKEFYRRRASAHKWLLVTCFGYLGYKNARFGKIEAHEAVTAYGREMLLRAKDLVEAEGFRVLHALTDSLWIFKRGAHEAEYQTLTNQIERATNLPIELEGIYKWVAFLPSRVNPYASVPNRYFGALRNGELKIRGIEARRGDTPEFISNLQMELLAEMAKANTRAELAAMVPHLIDIITAQLDRLRAGQVSFEELACQYRLSREPQEYAMNTLNAIVAKELLGRGVELEAGESIRYVVTDYKARVPSDRARAMEFLDGGWGYDVERYSEMVMRAMETVLKPISEKAMDALQLAAGSPTPQSIGGVGAASANKSLPTKNTGMMSLPLFRYASLQVRREPRARVTMFQPPLDLRS